MRLSIERLRGVLISGAVLLVVVLAAYIGYGRYRAYLFYRNLLKKNGITLTHDSNGVTFSQSLGGKTVFTLRAARATPAGDHKWTLHDAELTLYSRSSDRVDHISSAEIEWDEKQGIARAQGEVHIDLQAPQGIGGHGITPSENPQAAKHEESPDVIHVRTSGLVYLRKLGVAATEQPVEFRYGDLLCTARGAEFNTAESNLHLLADIVMDGTIKDKPLHLTAARADLDRTLNVANLLQPVLTSQGRSAQAGTAVLGFRTDGSLQHVLAQGSVLLRAPAQQITAAELQLAFTPQSIAQQASLTGGVTLTGTDPQRPVQGTARQVDVEFTPQGAPSIVTAIGAANLAMLDRRSVPAGLSRRVQGDRLIAHFLPAPRAAATARKQTTQLSEVEATGTAKAFAESLVAAPKGAAHTTALSQRKSTEVTADDLRLLFALDAEGASQPRQLLGTGHTHLQQDAPAAAQQSSTADTLRVDFTQATASAPLAIASAVQAGHVAVHLRPATPPNAKAPATITTAIADRATYDGPTERLTLSGAAHLSNSTADLLAATVILDQLANTADASGNVQSTLLGNPSAGATPNQHPATPTHILSASAHFEREGQLAQFHGTDAEPARMWQQASQVQAATLLFDGDRRTFSARPLGPGAQVHAVFAANAEILKSTAKPRSTSNNIVRVISPKMDYSDLTHEAVFSAATTSSAASAQHVQIDSSTGQALADRAVVLLLPPDKTKAATTTQANPVGGSLDRVILTGDVQLLQPGRRGTGEQLTYTAATGDYVLTGTPARPPHIVDAQQGSLTGTTLLFADSGSTIVVTGAADTQPRSDTQPHSGRVHTETPIRPKSR